MAFWLKKFVSFWLMPLPFCLTLLAAGWFIGRTARRSRIGRALVAAGIALLLAFSNKVVSTWLMRPLETRYPPVPDLSTGEALPSRLAACRYIVVLGGGHTDAPGFSAVGKLSTSALARIAEGVRLAKLLPGARLIVSGPAVGANPSHASVLARAAVSLGVEEPRIRLIDSAHDTEDEARATAAIVGAAPVALVTSAWHMPRAAALFRRSGIEILPCPTDYKTLSNIDLRLIDLTWDTESLDRSTCAVRERIGYAWAWLRGRL